MPTSFSRSLRSLESDRFRGSLAGIAVGLLLLGLWLAWFFLARVALYEVTDEARIEVGSEPHELMSLVAGRVVRSKMVLDREVDAGDLLVALDADEVRYQLQEERTEADGLREQVEQVAREIARQREALAQARRAVEAALDEAAARHAAALESARFAKQELARRQRLHEEGLISRSEVDSIETEVLQKNKEAEALQRALERTEQDRRSEITEKEAEVAALEGRKSELASAARQLDSSIAGLEYEMSLHELRAPVAGRIGDRLSLRAGEFVEKGQRLGTVIPLGDVRVVASFAARSIGRVQPGQRATLRLTGFSWVQYGSVPATVSRVGTEPQNGSVRVELSLDEPDAFPVSLSHGLPGTLEVEVEEVSPAALVLRAAGNVVSTTVVPESR